MSEYKSKKWQDKTRGGYPVRIYNEDANIHHHIHGAAAMGVCGQMNCISWKEDGHYQNEDSPWDLVPIRKRRYKTLNEIALDYSFDYSPHRIAIVGNDGVVYSMIFSDLCGGEVASTIIRSDEWLEIFTKWEEEV